MMTQENPELELFAESMGVFEKAYLLAQHSPKAEELAEKSQAHDTWDAYFVKGYRAGYSRARNSLKAKSAKVRYPADGWYGDATAEMGGSCHNIERAWNVMPLAMAVDCGIIFGYFTCFVKEGLTRSTPGWELIGTPTSADVERDFIHRFMPEMAKALRTCGWPGRDSSAGCYVLTFLAKTADQTGLSEAQRTYILSVAQAFR